MNRLLTVLITPTRHLAAVKMGKIPDRWEDYNSRGKVIKGTRFVAFKVPLNEFLSQQIREEQRFTPSDLIETLRTAGVELGLIIDLTNTMRYYRKEEIEKRGILHKKIFTEGHVVPSANVRQTFFDAVDDFLKSNDDNKSVIGVHCTHGVNRTGYLVCRYMIDKLKFTPDEAIEAFNEARGHKIERANYLADLRSGLSTSGRAPSECPERPQRRHDSRHAPYVYNQGNSPRKDWGRGQGNRRGAGDASPRVGGRGVSANHQKREIHTRPHIADGPHNYQAGFADGQGLGHDFAYRQNHSRDFTYSQDDEFAYGQERGPGLAYGQAYGYGIRGNGYDHQGEQFVGNAGYDQWCGGYESNNFFHNGYGHRPDYNGYDQLDRNYRNYDDYSDSFSHQQQHSLTHRSSSDIGPAANTHDPFDRMHDFSGCSTPTDKNQGYRQRQIHQKSEAGSDVQTLH